jgi:hypothetical protein
VAPGWDTCLNIFQQVRKGVKGAQKFSDALPTRWHVDIMSGRSLALLAALGWWLLVGKFQSALMLFTILHRRHSSCSIRSAPLPRLQASRLATCSLMRYGQGYMAPMVPASWGHCWIQVKRCPAAVLLKSVYVSAHAWVATFGRAI